MKEELGAAIARIPEKANVVSAEKPKKETPTSFEKANGKPSYTLQNASVEVKKFSSAQRCTTRGGIARFERCPDKLATPKNTADVSVATFPRVFAMRLPSFACRLD